jgi:hypothetical protein
MIDPTDGHKHQNKVIQDWHDPTGEADMKVQYIRLVQCELCGLLIEEAKLS